MLFGMVGRVGPRMCTADGSVDCPMEMGSFFGGDMGLPVVTNGEFVTLLCENV